MFLRKPRIWTRQLCSSPILCLISSAPDGTRIVALALPGGGGSAARARASAACFAAWRAAQGAAPRRPSLRFGASGVLSAFPAADLAPLLEPFASAAFPFAGFLVAAISLRLIRWSVQRPRGRENECTKCTKCTK